MALRSIAKLRWLLPAMGLLVAVAFISRRHIGGPGSGSAILEPAEAAAHLGRDATVCGKIVEATFVEGIDGRPTFLNFGGRHPDQVFTAVIWERHRHHFATPPDELFDGESACVTGRVREHRGVPQIEVSDPGAIRLGQPP